MKLCLRAVAVIAAVAFVGCKSSATPTRATPRGTELCAHFVAIGCSTGSRPGCAESIDAMAGAGYPLSCWFDATTVASAQSCGAKVCQ